MALLRGLDGALKACDCVVLGVKGDNDVGVGIGVLRIFFGGPSPESVAHVLDPANVLLRKGSVTGSGTLVEDVECVSNASLLERHYLPQSKLVLREHCVWSALLEAVEVVFRGVAPNAVRFVEKLGSHRLLEAVIVLVAPQLEVKVATSLALYVFV